MFYLSLGIVVLSSVLYHIFQKAISPTANPVISLMVTYSVAFALSMLLLYAFPLRTNLGDSLRALNWASIALAVAIVGIELGYLLAYRAGWNISLTGIGANTSAALLLLPIGVALFKERPSLINLAGVLVCVIGLVMVNHQR